MPDFRLPGGADRLTVIGMTGTGKTVLGAHVLSLQRWNERPWVAIDFKDEILWDKVGEPPMQELRLGGAIPKKPGFYRLRVSPRDDDAFEDWLWRVWEKGNTGLFCDEVSLVPKKEAFKGILRQGRSKRIPVIACTQRPVDCDREVFSESNYVACFRLKDARDYKIVKEFTGNFPIETPLGDHCAYWIDAKQNVLFRLRPCPEPDLVAKALRDAAPYSFSLFG